MTLDTPDFPQTLTLNITPDYIRKGHPRNSCRCPFALAALDALSPLAPNRAIAVSVTPNHIKVYDETNKYRPYLAVAYDNSPEMRDWIKEFDRQLSPVHPITVTLEQSAKPLPDECPF